VLLNYQELLLFSFMIEKDIKGHLILIMGPSGSGKGFLTSILRNKLGDKIHSAVSCTTRVKRPKEIEGETYFFLSLIEFKKKIENNEFLEWAEYSGNHYGTLKAEVLEPLRAGSVVVREVEIQGVLAIREIIPDENITIIYIDGGSWDQLRERIISRAPISGEELELRRERYVEESASKTYANIIIKNQKGYVEQAKTKLIKIVEDKLEEYS